MMALARISLFRNQSFRDAFHRLIHADQFDMVAMFANLKPATTTRHIAVMVGVNQVIHLWICA
jgi:hypothetical protein